MGRAEQLVGPQHLIRVSSGACSSYLRPRLACRVLYQMQS